MDKNGRRWGAEWQFVGPSHLPPPYGGGGAVISQVIVNNIKILGSLEAQQSVCSITQWAPPPHKGIAKGVRCPPPHKGISRGLDGGHWKSEQWTLGSGKEQTGILSHFYLQPKNYTNK